MATWGLADLLEKPANDPTGRFYLPLLSDGEANRGNQFSQELPDPEDLQKMGTYGRFNAEQLDQAVTAHPNAKVFACGQ